MRLPCHRLDLFADVAVIHPAASAHPPDPSSLPSSSRPRTLAVEMVVEVVEEVVEVELHVSSTLKVSV
jgi:hypothetical protein